MRSVTASETGLIPVRSRTLVWILAWIRVRTLARLLVRVCSRTLVRLVVRICLVGVRVRGTTGIAVSVWSIASLRSVSIGIRLGNSALEFGKTSLISFWKVSLDGSGGLLISRTRLGSARSGLVASLSLFVSVAHTSSYKAIRSAESRLDGCRSRIFKASSGSAKASRKWSQAMLSRALRSTSGNAKAASLRIST